MKLDFLEKLEEKFVFKTSHFFFHFLVGLAILGFLGGIGLFLWGITPSLKPGVEKAEYPPVIQVTAEELALAVIPPQKGEKAKQPSPAQSSTSEMFPAAAAEEKGGEAVDSTKIAYEQAIDSLKTLIPPQKYLWPNRSHRERGYYRDQRGRYQYGEHWVVDSYGIQSRLDEVFRKIGAANFTQKTEIIYSYLPILNRFEEKDRYGALKSLFLHSKDNVATAKSNMKLLDVSVKTFANDRADILYKLAQFGDKNPRDGAAFIAYSNQIITQFDQAHTTGVLDALINTYYRYFDNIELQKRITELFLPLLPNFEGEYQAKALETFYVMYLDKNQTRESQIRQIESQYQRDLQQAEAVVQEKKIAKAANRYQGLIAIGSSIATIAVIALVLVLLSIQRNVRAIKAATLERELVEEQV